MRRVVGVAFAVVMTVVLLLVLQRGCGDADAPARDGDAPAERSAEPERERVRLGGEPPPPAQTATADEAPPAETPPLVVTISDDDAAGVLLVIERATETPVGGARVQFLPVDPDDGTAMSRMQDEIADPLHVRLTGATWLVSDDAGRVNLPAFDAFAVVHATKGELVGGWFLDSQSPDEWRIEMAVPRWIHVEVVDAASAPAPGVQVSIVMSSEYGEWPTQQAITDDSGSARMMAPDADEVEQSGEDVEWECAVTLALPLDDRPRVIIDPADPPTDPIRLVLPGTGSVRCVVTGLDSLAGDQALSVSLTRSADDESRHLEFGGQPDPYAVEERIDDGGSARFPRVGVGLKLRARVTVPDGSRLPTSVEFTGPTRADEETVVEIALGVERPIVVGRLVAESGEPVVGVEISGEVLRPGEVSEFDWGSRLSSTTDADGRFRFAIDHPPGPAENVSLRLGRQVRSAGPSFSEREFATVQLPARLVVGENDVGDVTYGGTALVVSGRVVDPSGKPLAGVTVAAMEVQRGMKSPVEAVDAAETDSEGRFELRGAAAGPNVLLGAAKDGFFLREAAEFAVGTTDATISLDVAGGIAGTLKLPDGLDGSDVRVLITGEPQQVFDTDYRFQSEGLDVYAWEGQFAVLGLRPGTAVVSVRVGYHDSDTVLELDDVVVVAGTVTRDPRLQDIDLGAAMQHAKVTVLGPGGKPLRAARVHVLIKADFASWESFNCDGDGTAHLSYTGEVERVVVTNAGHRAAVLETLVDGATVRLTPVAATKVTLVLRDGVELLPPPFALEGSLAWIGPPGTDAGAGDDDFLFSDDPRSSADGHGSGRIGSSRTQVVTVYEPGTYVVALTFWRTTIDGASGGPLPTRPRRVSVEVSGDGLPLRVEFTPDPEQLRRRIERDDD